MASSGSYDFTLNTYKIITGAMRLIGAIQTGETPPAEEYEDALDSLNGLVSHWQASGIHVWSQLDATLFLQPGQIRYLIGQNSADHCTPSSEWFQTALTRNASLGDTAITVVSAAAIAMGDNIGVVLDSGVLFWTSAIAAPVANVVSLATPLPGPATGAAVVINYIPKMVRPLKVPHARRCRLQADGHNIEVPLTIMSRLDYAAIPNKTNQGVPTQIFFDPQLGNAVMQIWPEPLTAIDAVKFTAQRPIQDFVTQRDTADLPVEWMSTIRYNLALELAPEYDCPAERFKIIGEMAAAKLAVCQQWDREPESIYFGLEAYPASRN